MGKSEQVAVVTGASRGAGRGIAEALGAAGYTVYVTGRTERPGEAALPGTIHDAAEAVTRAGTRAGGQGIAVRVDHADDASVADLFARVQAEAGHIDVLVNNAAVIGDALITPGPFWEKPLELADILDVGLRCHYVASWHAAKLMAPRGRGLIAFTSSFGSVCYMHGPAYGAQKAGVDKFAADMAVDFQGTGLAAVSIWMGPLLTERFARALAERPDQYEGFAAVAETPRFTGCLIAALAADPDLQSLNGQTLIGAELAARYGLQDEGGKQPPSYREMLGAPRVPHPAVVR
jgi:NAD(P)-dependent dehydrogenase (short-subunit alcohol dehydrogenase family)